MRPFYSHQAKDTTPKAHSERRRRWLMRLWWDYSDDLGFFLWCIVGVIIGVLGTLVYGFWPR